MAETGLSEPRVKLTLHPARPISPAWPVRGFRCRAGRIHPEHWVAAAIVALAIANAVRLLAW